MLRKSNYIIDLTKSLTNFTRGIDGIARVELAVANELFSLGGRAIWIVGKTIYEVREEQFKSLFSGAESSETARAGKIAGLLRTFNVNRSQAAIERMLRRFKFLPEGGESYFLFGAYWDRSSQHIPELLRAQPGARLFCFVHDLIPALRPELTHDPGEMSRSFPQYLGSITSVSKGLIVSSNFTADELQKYCRAQKWKLPAVSVVALGSDLDLRAVPIASKRLTASRLEAKNFALMVSTLEPRKNHRFACDLWKNLQSSNPDLLFPLVFAGKRGWLKSGLIRAIEKSSKMLNSGIRFIDTPSDDELAWLYQNAKFTIYPSEMEGWGLPVCESLSFRTYCLAADNSALKESSQGLAWHGSLNDQQLWLAEIQHCLSDAEYLLGRTSKIEETFKKRRWRDVTQDLVNLVNVND